MKKHAFPEAKKKKKKDTQSTLSAILHSLIEQRFAELLLLPSPF